jgi:hypothetical protein
MEKAKETKVEPKAETKAEPKAKKEKKAKKFNSERTARLTKNALKAVFPNDSFVVSSLVEKVEVLYPSNNKLTPEQTEKFKAQLNTFKAVFCELAKVKKEEIEFYPYEKKAA